MARDRAAKARPLFSRPRSRCLGLTRSGEPRHPLYLGRDASPGAPDVRALLARIAALPIEEAPAVGLGHELRIAAQDAAGAALLVDDRLAHLMVFPTAAFPAGA